jgi:hypothetical protein
LPPGPGDSVVDCGPFEPGREPQREHVTLGADVLSVGSDDEATRVAVEGLNCLVHDVSVVASLAVADAGFASPPEPNVEAGAAHDATIDAPELTLAFMGFDASTPEHDAGHTLIELEKALIIGHHVTHISLQHTGAAGCVALAYATWWIVGCRPPRSRAQATASAPLGDAHARKEDLYQDP